MSEYEVYIPYTTYTEHNVEADSPEAARKIAWHQENLDQQLLDNLEVQDEYIEIKKVR